MMDPFGTEAPWRTATPAPPKSRCKEEAFAFPFCKREILTNWDFLFSSSTRRRGFSDDFLPENQGAAKPRHRSLGFGFRNSKIGVSLPLSLFSSIALLMDIVSNLLCNSFFSIERNGSPSPLSHCGVKKMFLKKKIFVFLKSFCQYTRSEIHLGHSLGLQHLLTVMVKFREDIPSTATHRFALLRLICTALLLEPFRQRRSFFLECLAHFLGYNRGER